MCVLLERGKHKELGQFALCYCVHVYMGGICVCMEGGCMCVCGVLVSVWPCVHVCVWGTC